MLLDDAVVAISIIDLSAIDGDGCSVLPPGCTVPTHFPDEPDAAFAELSDKLVAAVRFGGVPAQALGWE